MTDIQDVKEQVIDAIRDLAGLTGVIGGPGDEQFDAITNDVMPVILARIEQALPARYRWTDFEPDDCDCSSGIYTLAIWDPDNKPVAYITIVTHGGLLTGPVATGKRATAQHIVDALNAYDPEA